MIWEQIKNTAKQFNNKTALICHDKEYTYSELVDSVEKLIAVLSTTMKPGERILFASEKEYHYVRMILACDALGVTFMPTFPNLPDAVVAQLVNASKPNHVILSEHDAENMKPHGEAINIDNSPDDMYTVIFTSGTTGEPKAVPHTRESCYIACKQNIDIHTITDNDLVLSQFPPWSVGGLHLYCLPGLMAGCTVIIELFSPRRYVELNKRYKPNIGIIVPAMMVALSKVRAWADLDMSHWRELGIGSTVTPQEMIDKLFDKGVPAIRNVLGSTEAHVPMLNHVFTKEDPHHLQLKCSPNYEYKFDKDNVMWMRGPTVTKGYLNKETPFDEEGFWCTDDIYDIKDGMIFYKSRKSDMMKVNSFNVSPVNIENAIIPFPNVLEVCVSYRSRDLGEKEIVAIVSADVDINTDDIFNFIREKLFQHELPKQIIVTKEPLPRNRMGKIQRHIAKEKFIDSV